MAGSTAAPIITTPMHASTPATVTAAVGHHADPAGPSATAPSVAAPAALAPGLQAPSGLVDPAARVVTVAEAALAALAVHAVAGAAAVAPAGGTSAVRSSSC